MFNINLRTLLLVLGLLLWGSATAFAQGTAFTYQGKLLLSEFRRNYASLFYPFTGP
jgi:hypothetical protein